MNCEYFTSQENGAKMVIVDPSQAEATAEKERTAA